MFPLRIKNQRPVSLPPCIFDPSPTRGGQKKKTLYEFFASDCIVTYFVVRKEAEGFWADEFGLEQVEITLS